MSFTSLSLPSLPSAYLGKFPVREEFEPKAERQSPKRFLSCFCPQYAEVYPSWFENAIRACAADMTKRQILQAEPRLRCCRRHTLTQIREKRNTKRSCLPKCNVIQLLQSQPTPKPKPKLSHSTSPSPSQCQCQCQLIAANCCCCCCCYGYCCCCPGAAMVIAQSTPATTDERTTVETCKMRLGCCWLKYIYISESGPRRLSSHHAAYEQSFNCYSFTRCRACPRPEALL